MPKRKAFIVPVIVYVPFPHSGPTKSEVAMGQEAIDLLTQTLDKTPMARRYGIAYSTEPQPPVVYLGKPYKEHYGPIRSQVVRLALRLLQSAYQTRY